MRKGDEIKENVIELMRSKLDLYKEDRNVYGVGDNVRFYLKASAEHHPKYDKRYFFDITPRILRHDLTQTDADGKPEHRFVLFCLGYMNGMPERVYAVPSCYLTDLADSGKFSVSRDLLKLSIEIDDYSNPQHQWIIEDPKQTDLAEHSYNSIEDLIYRICVDRDEMSCTYYISPEEIISRDLYPERFKRQVVVNAYERSSEARQKCIEHYGTKCQVCGLDFVARYGEPGAGFIHVHHIKPLSEANEGYKVNPKKDLIPVCPNCHAMVHRKRPAYSIEEVGRFIEKAKAEQR